MVCKFNQKSMLSKFDQVYIQNYKDLLYKLSNKYQYIHHKVYVFIMYLFNAAVVNIPFYIFGQT
jgi:hypothetical protein